MNKTKAENQLDIRITKERDPELFEFFSAGQPIKLLREKFQSYSELQQKLQQQEQLLVAQRNDLVGIKLSTRQAQKNTEILLGIVNSYLFTQPAFKAISRKQQQAPVIAFFESEHKQMLDDLTQRKVYKDKPTQPTENIESPF